MFPFLDGTADGAEDGDSGQPLDEMPAPAPYISREGKRNSCHFCRKKVAVLWRHIKTAHAEEDEVIQINACTDMTEKNRRLSLLRYRGNFEHNKRVIQKGRGQLIVGRRSVNAQYTASDFLPCPHCLVFVLRFDLHRHRSKYCLVRHNTDQAEGTKDLVYESQLLMNDSGHSNYSKFESEILSRMTDGQVKQTIRNDGLIMKFGSMLHEKLGGRGFNTISQRLRAIASFLQLTSVKDMSSLLAPEHIDEAIRCAKVLGGLDDGTTNAHTELPEYSKPSKAMRIGGELRQLSLLKKGVSLEKRDKQAEKDAEDFMVLLDLYWNTRVAHVALQTREAKKYDKINVLPLTEDLKKFTEKIKAALSLKTLAGVASKESYVSLTKHILARLLVFNKRRPAEVSRILLATWTGRSEYKKETISEIKESMGRVERQLYDKMDVIMVRGKRGNKVPVLIPSDASKAIDVLVAARSDFVSGKNKFLLAAPDGRTGHYQGSKVLQKVCMDMALEQPGLFTATKLRKYCGTTSQMLALTDSDFETLTRHMGHDRNVHNEYYRLPDTTLELTKAAVLMSCLDEGNISKYAGKDLGTILELQPEEQEEEDEDEEDQGQEEENEGVERGPKKRQRFNAAQCKALTRLLKARDAVPSTAELKDWCRGEGRLFGGKSVGQVRRKLYYMLNVTRQA